MENVGCFSYLTISWMTKFMVKAYKSGLSVLDLGTVADRDQAKYNAERLQRFWDAEQREAKAKNKKPSLTWAIWKFGRTRFLLSILFLILSLIMQFLGPVMNL